MAKIEVDLSQMSPEGLDVLYQGGDFGIGGDEAPVTIDGELVGKAGWLDFQADFVAIYCLNGFAFTVDNEKDELIFV